MRRAAVPVRKGTEGAVRPDTACETAGGVGRDDVAADDTGGTVSLGALARSSVSSDPPTHGRILQGTLLEAEQASIWVPFRVVALDHRRRSLAWIDCANPKAWPLWVTWGTVQDALQAGELRIARDDPWLTRVVVSDAELSKAARAQRDARWAVIRPLVDPDATDARDPGASVSSDDGAVRGPFEILEPATRYALVRAAHIASGKAEDKIYKWLRRYWQHGCLENALLPDFGRCGSPRTGKPRAIGPAKRGRPSKLAIAEPGFEGMNVTEEVRKKLVAGGKRWWKKKVDGRRLTLREAYDNTLLDFFSTRLDVIEGKLVPIVFESHTDVNRVPTFDQFCYWFSPERRPESDMEGRYGTRVSNLRHRAVLGSSRHLSDGPTDLSQIDATVGDLYLVSRTDRRRVIGRPVIYKVPDHATEMITGLHVGLEGPNWTGAMMAFENSVSDKVDFCARYGIEIEPEDWPCQHVPAKLLADRGELLSKHADMMVPGLRMTVSNAPTARGDWKSLVEGLFKEANETTIARLPGWVDRHRDRSGPDYRFDACLTIEEFTKLMIQLVLYHNTRKASLNRPKWFPVPEDGDVRPIDLWTYGMMHRPGGGRVVSPDLVRRNLLPTTAARATHRGFAVKTDLLHYESIIARERGWFGRQTGRRGQAVNLRLDVRDIRSAFLWWPEEKVWETCPLTPADMARYADPELHPGPLSLAEVECERDLKQMSDTKLAPKRALDRLAHRADVDAIVSEAQRKRSAALAEGERVNVRGLRQARMQERDGLRQQEAFTELPDITPRGLLEDASDDWTEDASVEETTDDASFAVTARSLSNGSSPRESTPPPPARRYISF